MILNFALLLRMREFFMLQLKATGQHHQFPGLLKQHSGIFRIFTVLLLLFVLFTPSYITAQDSIRKKDFKEWDEILKLRKRFLDGPYGSPSMMGIFDGRFVGPNDKLDYGIRSFTTAYDYLILGNNLLSLIINLGYTADNVKFVSTSKVPNSNSYKLGCIWFYTIAADKIWIDSVYSTKLGRTVAADDPHFIHNSRLKIDSTHVKIDLAGLVRKTKVGKETIYDTLLLPPVDGTGSWKDANNYDLAYEWMEFIFEQYKDSFDISRRQFSKKTPEEVKIAVLQRYNTQQYLDKHQLQEMDLDIHLKDQMGKETFDLLHQPNGKIFRIGNYDVFRFFTDVYWKVATQFAERTNSVWHCAFQYDKDVEKNSKGLIDFVVLGYGAKDYIMPTVIPRNLPAFTQFEGVVIYQTGAERENHSNNDDIWINTLNGRMIDRNFFEYPFENGILPLNDDGTVDRIYKIYAWKDKKSYWAYIYCGKHSGVRGGKPGKSFVDQVDNFKQQYKAIDYWYFVEKLDYKKDVEGDLPKFTNNTYDFVHKVSGVTGKTVPSIDIHLEKANPKNEKKPIEYYKNLTMFDDYTAKLEPDGLIIPWEIEEKTDERLRTSRRVLLHVLGEEVYIEDLDDYILNRTFSGSEVNKFNKKFLEERESFVEIPDSSERTTEIYNKQAYDLTNSEDVRTLIDRILEDIAAVEYQLPQLLESIEWQKTNKVENLEKRMAELVDNGQENTEIYKKLNAEYEKESGKLIKLEEDQEKFESRKIILVNKLHKFRDKYINNLESDLAHLAVKKSFINDQIRELEKNMGILESEGKADTDAYRQMKQSLTNKDAEIKEVEDKVNDVQKLLAEQRNIADQEN